MQDLNTTLQTRLQVLRSIFGDLDFNSSKLDAKVFCPFHYHRKKKLEINVEKNVFNCWVCGAHGNIFKLLGKIATQDQKATYFSTVDNFKWRNNNTSSAAIDLPEEYRFLLDNLNLPLAKKVKDYLFGDLGLKEDVIVQNLIGFCSSGMYENRIIFPSRDNEGRFNFFSGQEIFPNYKKHLDCSGIPKSSIVFNELFVDWTRPVVLVESIKSHLRLFQYNTIPILGKMFSEHCKVFEQIVLNDSEVLVALDPDAENKSFDVAKLLSVHGINSKIVQLEEKPYKMEPNDFEKCLSRAHTLTNDDYLLYKLRKI